MVITDKHKAALFDSFGTEWAKKFTVKSVCKVLGIVSLVMLAKRCNASPKTVFRRVSLNRIPGPSVRFRKLWYWTELDAKKVERYWDEHGMYSPRKPKFDYEAIRRLARQGLTQVEISTRIGCSQAAVSRILNGRKYATQHKRKKVKNGTY